MNFNKRNILLAAIVMLLIFWGMIYFLNLNDFEPVVEKLENNFTHPPCLQNNESVSFKIERLGEYTTDVKYNEGVVKIVVKQINSDNEVIKFDINNIQPGYYHLIETHKCGIYIVRSFELDEKKGIHKRAEFWKYTYDSNGKMLMSDEEYKPYSLDFRVDKNENYVILERGYLGRDDYALLVKDLKTLNDAFTFPFSEIEKHKPEIIGNISFENGGWSSDGRYFWADTHYGATTLGFIRIDTKNWQVDLFKAPEGVLGGDALNVNTGHITIQPDSPWIGIYEMEKEEKEKRRIQGIGTELYIESLFTKERHFVASTTESLYYFKPNWLSDTELEYELPSGEKKIYKINEKQIRF